MNLRKLIIVLLSITYATTTIAQEVPEKVLFVGNSYTYFWNLPQTVAAMAASQDIDLSTSQSTSGGTHWGHHWRGERNLSTKELIQEGDFDAVILQNHSRSALDRPDSLRYFGQLLNQKIRSTNAATYLYITWAREWDPYMQEEITKQYIALAEQLNARIVPVGLAWERARQLRPGFPLFDPDGSHPSSLGTYLSACVFYGVLTGKTPVGLPNRLLSKDINGEKLYLTIQQLEDAIFCQKVAEEIINKVID